jgi:Zn-finger domain-containing protein
MGKIQDMSLISFILEEMRECVEYDNFVIKRTDKNKEFISEYALTREMQRDMLLAIAVEDYFNSSESRNFPEKYVHEFCPLYNLCTVDGKDELVSTYVKFELENDVASGEQAVVISFHSAERPVHYPFTESK